MGDPLVQCPFELSHRCKRSRFQQHLIKCHKNHPESPLKPCPYNATEYIHPDNLIEHLKNCKSAKLLESQKYIAEQHKENYLDAPFHLPKRKVEDSFESEDVRVNDEDERVLERSVSQMSLNSIASVQSFGSKILKSSTPGNALRCRGRGYALARLVSCTRQMDYSQYEKRSTVTDSEFGDASEDELKFSDTSVCASESTITGNTSSYLSSGMTNEPPPTPPVLLRTPPLLPKASNELSKLASSVRGCGRGRGYALAQLVSCTHEMDYSKYEISSTVTDRSQLLGSKLNTAQPSPLSETDESEFGDASEEELKFSDDTSVCASLSTITENDSMCVRRKHLSLGMTFEPGENLLQNKNEVRRIEKTEGKMRKFVRVRSGYNIKTADKPGSTKSPSVAGRGAMKYASLDAQSDYTRDHPHSFTRNLEPNSDKITNRAANNSHKKFTGNKVAAKNAKSKCQDSIAAHIQSRKVNLNCEEKKRYFCNFSDAEVTFNVHQPEEAPSNRPNQINSGNKSSRTRAPQKRQRTFESLNSRGQQNSDTKISGGGKWNFNPSHKYHKSQQTQKSSDPSCLKKAQSGKHSSVIVKEKINHSKRKHPAKNRLRYPHGLNWLSMLSNPFEKPVAFGPPQSSHLEYRSYEPLLRNPFDLS